MSNVILIAGGTASGKTTIATAFAAQNPHSVLIHHDRYYKDIPHPRGYNFDEPNALDSAHLAKDIQSLKKGTFAELPVYDFSRHARSMQTERIYPKPIIIVEGILVLAAPELYPLADGCVFVDAPDDIRLIRRIRRDVVERGRNVEGVLEQYLQTVRPMHHQHVLPSKRKASLHLDGQAPVAESVRRLQEYIDAL
ncbi:MAG: uridine kinase [Myxococcota bacterium]|nr:uridine kinase [Myxococcota bacterium]